MFEDRSKSKYDFNKIDQNARTAVQVLDEKEQKSEAHKKLFGANEIVPAAQQKEIIKQAITRPSLDELPSSAYLKSFEDQVAVEVDQIHEEPQEQLNEENYIDFASIVESEKLTNISVSKVNKELEKNVPKPKKNYSFRIKLTGCVYCILVALFGGWVVGNAVNISQTNSYLYETYSETSSINQNILDIIGDIAKLDSVSADPEDDTIVVKIATEEIDITPEAINKPNDYEKESNWFDIICNWIARLFG